MTRSLGHLDARECLTLYNKGYAIGEIGSLRGCSYTGMRKLLLRNGARFRNKQEAYRVMLSRRPEWKRQFLKYTVSDESRKLSFSKLFFVFRHEGVFSTCTKKEDVMCILNSCMTS